MSAYFHTLVPYTNNKNNIFCIIEIFYGKNGMLSAINTSGYIVWAFFSLSLLNPLPALT
jgi:hypothetical protein